MMRESWERLATSERHHVAWGWRLAGGICLVILGIVALSATVATTVISVILFGILLIAAGIVEIAFGLAAGGLRNIILWTIVGMLCIIAGGLLITRPAAGALALTWVIAGYLILSGVIRLVSLFVQRERDWGYVALAAALNLLLGILLIVRWPVSGLVAIGLFIGINFLIDGALLIWSALVNRGSASSPRMAAQ
jgi:uncharacterized membrane protein HdeD (DUF308 family)